jgi:hypothetical protein
MGEDNICRDNHFCSCGVCFVGGVLWTVIHAVRLHQLHACIAPKTVSIRGCRDKEERCMTNTNALMKSGLALSKSGENPLMQTVRDSISTMKRQTAMVVIVSSFAIALRLLSLYDETSVRSRYAHSYAESQGHSLRYFSSFRQMQEGLHSVILSDCFAETNREPFNVD